MEKACASERDMRRQYGALLARKIGQRLAALEAAENLEDLRPPAVGKCHELTGDYAGCLALNLDANWRLIFRPERWSDNGQGGLDWSAVDSVVVLSIVDYH
ncbi:hypothetical protein GCM10010495_10980 [Kitasatospora herbaricolor]|uniref:type II toxin-antitoxin system RelE/ParE family toxin n=1 Tax=Kitasatospora herbaricolor TaxID=68217 RepID=UPI00174DE867|nr:type II toxin-antitoxin system RelE/ParE family toxin [Kitasatospora herbaricolor]MDQ0309465.1 proteic killer suppression protein [Kitasatospora herbaricolor]GGV01664.1 hypothetical protein GCM10010495_10980 [Kitasatospora herbaricolor]